jgi:hypothetical protein
MEELELVREQATRSVGAAGKNDQRLSISIGKIDDVVGIGRFPSLLERRGGEPDDLVLEAAFYVLF